MVRHALPYRTSLVTLKETAIVREDKTDVCVQAVVLMLQYTSLMTWLDPVHLSAYVLRSYE